MDRTVRPEAVSDVVEQAGSTMRAIVQDRYGSADVLRSVRTARPEFGAGEVLLRVRAAGVNRGVWHLMTGRPYLLRLAFGLRRPKNRVPGQDVAGTVVATGPAVTGFAVGDEVFGIARGAFAEFAAARSDKIARKPASLTFEQAAVVGVSAITALQALVDTGRVEPGQRVLITGASGGVGSYAVQLAAAIGAVVTGVCSTPKLDLVRSLGATHVVDYTREDFADTGHRYDLILDIAGLPKLQRLRRALAPNGTLVLVGGEDGGDWTGGTIGRQLRARATSLFSRQRLTSILAKERAGDFERLATYLQAGTVIPSIERTYPLEEVPDALRHLEAGNVRAKVAIAVLPMGTAMS
ncbi:NAD(P)-dependent alcohol dehydrogenase [Nakamurella lactea]|uniref:NAD(P)-dependent alcohol dehydrogenase n=1 Tax=Nakamurella lactea TaxID=459515 RepID=UPI0003F63CCD